MDSPPLPPDVIDLTDETPPLSPTSPNQSDLSLADQQPADNIEPKEESDGEAEIEFVGWRKAAVKRELHGREALMAALDDLLRWGDDVEDQEKVDVENEESKHVSQLHLACGRQPI